MKEFKKKKKNKNLHNSPHGGCPMCLVHGKSAPVLCRAQGFPNAPLIMVACAPALSVVDQTLEDLESPLL